MIPCDDWMFEKVPGIPGPPPRMMYKGPDVLRPGAGFSGTGEAFIFSADGTLIWVPGLGHETLIDNTNPDLREMLSHSFSPEEIEEIGTKTSYHNQPFYNNQLVRSMWKRRAIFGRVGRVDGYDMLSLWIGTNDLIRLLPMLIDKMLAEHAIYSGTLVSIGQDVMYTVGYFLAKSSEQGDAETASEGKITANH